jgi:signal transduction histidine kinase/ActR/RegA family two-component response regulator
LYQSPEQRKAWLSELEAKGELRNAELFLRRKDGRTVVALENARVVRNESGSLLYYEGTVTDITELKDLEEQLRQSQKMEAIGRLAGGIAHDFNNILMIILGYASLLTQGNLDATAISPIGEGIVKGVQRGAGLVRQILTFARKSEVVSQPVKMNHAIRELINLLKQTFPKTIEICEDLDPALPEITVDQNQVHQALLNICVNSRDAMPEGGTITISTRMVSGKELQEKITTAHQDEYLEIQVSDTGVGMTEAIRSHAFEPFFTTKDRGKGTGLGLSVAYGVVKSHQGFIDIYSEIGSGTKVSLYFPMETSRLYDPGNEDLDTLPGGAETILLVEDEEVLLDLIKNLLERKGYTVLPAKDGMDAVAVFRSHKEDIDLVITDLGLPKLGGWQAFLKMREEKPDVPSIIASGHIESDLRSEMLKAGAKDFVQKPYYFNEILRKVRDVLNSSKQA